MVFDELTALHDRVPLPMSPTTLEAWLDPEVDDAAGRVDLVRSGAHDAAAGWTLDAVGPAVGNVRNNSPDLIKPVEALFREALLWCSFREEPQTVTLPSSWTVHVGL